MFPRGKAGVIPIQDGDDVSMVVVDQSVVATEVRVADDVRTWRRLSPLDRAFKPVELRLDLAATVAYPRVVEAVAHCCQGPGLVDRWSREIYQRVFVHESHRASERGCIGARRVPAANEGEYRYAPTGDHRRRQRRDHRQVKLVEHSQRGRKSVVPHLEHLAAVGPTARQEAASERLELRHEETLESPDVTTREICWGSARSTVPNDRERDLTPGSVDRVCCAIPDRPPVDLESPCWTPTMLCTPLTSARKVLQISPMAIGEIRTSVVDDDAWRTWGYFVLPGFASDATCKELLEFGKLQVADPEAAARRGVAFRYEKNFSAALTPCERISKVAGLHQLGPFRELCEADPLGDVLAALIRGSVSVFLSQVAFKLPGALGQPWHQDSALFPFDPAGPVVGLWLTLTDSNGQNSCLSVIPGSHGELLPHHFDPSAPTGGRYLELREPPTTPAVQIELEAGDLLVFEGRLIHRSSDNVSRGMRAAAVLHCASSATVDHSVEHFRRPLNDWMPLPERRIATTSIGV